MEARCGGGTDLSQWLHTLGSSGLRATAAEMKRKMRSHSRASLDAIVLVPGPSGSTDTNQIVNQPGGAWRP